MNTKKKVFTLMVVVALLVATFSIMMVGCKPADLGGVNEIAVGVDMGELYFVGKNGTVDLSKVFGKEKCKITSGDSASIDGNTLTVNGTTPFEMTVGGDSKKVTVVADGYNVSTYDDFRAKVDAGQVAVVQATEFAMTAEKGTINVKNSIYGNGVNIDGTAVAKASGDKGWKTAGSNVMSVNVTKQLTIRDVHAFGIKTDPELTIKQFNNVGSALAISGDENGGKSNVDVIHCVLENGHKVFHINNSNVNMTGCIVRNASDTTVSIGTFDNKKSTVNMTDNVIANSLTAGVVIYDYSVTGSSAKTWNEINVKGFLDIYNWRSAKNLSFLPDTELGGSVFIVDTINSFVGSDISPEDKYAELKAVAKDGSQYLHMGIFKIC
ncbi:MAG: hypothetical protein RSD04_01630, partial [Clostridia bacterium]